MGAPFARCIAVSVAMVARRSCLPPRRWRARGGGCPREPAPTYLPPGGTGLIDVSAEDLGERGHHAAPRARLRSRTCCRLGSRSANPKPSTRIEPAPGTVTPAKRRNSGNAGQRTPGSRMQHHPRCPTLRTPGNGNPGEGRAPRREHRCTNEASVSGGEANPGRAGHRRIPDAAAQGQRRPQSSFGVRRRRLLDHARKRRRLDRHPGWDRTRSS